MKLLRHIISLVCIATAFLANAAEQLTAKAEGAANQPIAAELQLLQGTWEGGEADNKGTSKNPDSQETKKRNPGVIDLDFFKTGVSEPPSQSHGKITITITGNSLHFHRDTNFWFETTITLPAGKDPKQLHATIKDCPPAADSIGKVVRAFYKIEDGTLTLATMGDDAEETPKGFEAAIGNRYELRKVQPQKKNAEPPETK